MDKAIYAEDVNYWKTSRSADKAIREAKKHIADVGGQVTAEGFLRTGDHAAWMLAFTLQGSDYRCVWPVLESRTGNENAAKVQAAVALKHDIKAKCVAVKWLGPEQAFARERLLPDGRTIGEATAPEIARMLPQLERGDYRDSS